MNILLKREDFSTAHYDLRIGKTAMEFADENEPFFLPYAQIMDFIITRDTHEKLYFSMSCAGRLYEGRILEEREAEAFTTALKEKLGGIISIEVRRN